MSTIKIPRDQWIDFLRNFTEQHRGRAVQIQTRDIQTHETVLSEELPLQSIEFDLEDESNPRINVIVEMGNKVIKQMLLMPSQLIFSISQGDEALHVESLNTSTTIHLRAAAPKTKHDAA